MQGDTYKTLAAASEEILYKEKNSKFFGYAFPVTSEQDIRFQLDHLRKRHPGAGHFCYAWRLGIENVSWRANDDGEPKNSAGIPILGQLQSFGVTNVLVVIVRFFGGVKLGVGGLVAAYRVAAQMALDKSEIVEKIIQWEYVIEFDYPVLSKVMRMLREINVEITGQEHHLKCKVFVAVGRSDDKKLAENLSNLPGVILKRK